MKKINIVALLAIVAGAAFLYFRNEIESTGKKTKVSKPAGQNIAVSDTGMTVDDKELVRSITNN